MLIHGDTTGRLSTVEYRPYDLISLSRFDTVKTWLKDGVCYAFAWLSVNVQHETHTVCTDNHNILEWNAEGLPAVFVGLSCENPVEPVDSCMCWITLSSSQRGCWLRSSAWCHVCKCHHLTPLKYTPVVTVARCKFVRVTCWEALKPFLSESVVGCVSCVMVFAVCLFVFRCYAF